MGSGLELWAGDQGRGLTGCGERALLHGSWPAFCSSRQCPGVAFRAAMDWALVQAKERRPVVCGIHSPLEQSVLAVLLQAR